MGLYIVICWFVKYLIMVEYCCFFKIWNWSVILEVGYIDYVYYKVGVVNLWLVCVSLDWVGCVFGEENILL